MTTTTPSRFRRAAVALVAALVAMAGVMVLPSDPVGAVGNGGWAVEPSGPNGTGSRDYFVYTLAPGQGFQDTVGISNYSDQPLTFKVYARDAFSAGGDAGFGVQGEDEQPSDVGSWIQLAVGNYTVQPGKRADIPFIIQVPPNASPGDHSGGIVGALVTDLQQSQEGTGLNILQRIAARVYVRVSGRLDPALDVRQLSLKYDGGFMSLLGGAKATVTYELFNAGNVRLDPLTTVKLQDPFGRTVRSKVARQLPELLPGGSIIITEEFQGVPPTLRLTAEVSAMTQGEAPTSTTRSTSVWAVPWLLVVLLAVVLIAGFLRWRARRRRRADSPPSRPAPPRQPAMA